MKKIWAYLCICLLMLCACTKPAGEETKTQTDTAAEAEDKGEIILATTTSTKDSGLLDEILPVFEAATGYSVNVISVGSGEAMKMGENGEADVLLVHSPAAERTFVEEGHADEDGRKDVMFNDFIIVGPKTDPEKLAQNSYNDAVASFKKLSESTASNVFISRADESGTHKKELAIWEKCEVLPEGDWYVEAGTGMGAVLEMANEMQAYTLSDRATWLNVGTDMDLKIVCELDESGILYNQYGVICVNPDKNDNINHEGAKSFQNWILSEETQVLIGEYGTDKYGAPLFTPNAE